VGVMLEDDEPAVKRGASFCRFAPSSGPNCMSNSVRCRLLALVFAAASGAGFFSLLETLTSSR
jgi:hypothetical protein